MLDLNTLKPETRAAILNFDNAVKALNNECSFAFITEDISTGNTWILGYIFSPEIDLADNYSDTSFAHFYAGDKCILQLEKISDEYELEAKEFPNYNDSINSVRGRIGLRTKLTWKLGLNYLKEIQVAFKKDTNIF